MFSRTFLVALLAAVTEARFSQERGNGAIDAILALGDLGKIGQAAGLAGGSIQFLLAAANPCGKLTQADSIITELGTSERAVAAARGLVAAEQNFNPFIANIPTICSDPTLPKSAELRGVVPLIDPAVVGSEIQNANSKKSVIEPFEATGLSVAQVMVANGFSNFETMDTSGKKANASTLAGGAAPPSNASAEASGASGSEKGKAEINLASIQADAEKPAEISVSNTTSTDGTGLAPGTCTGAGQTLVCAGPAPGTGAVDDPVKGTFAGFQPSSIVGLDFGLCTPTLKFEGGQNGRAETQITFQAQDPLCNRGQQDAFNPNIVTDHIQNTMVDPCGANQAAKDAIAAAIQAISSLPREAATAEAWNTMLGFDGTDINPDKAPKPGLVGRA